MFYKMSTNRLFALDKFTMWLKLHRTMVFCVLTSVNIERTKSLYELVGIYLEPVMISVLLYRILFQRKVNPKYLLHETHSNTRYTYRSN